MRRNEIHGKVFLSPIRTVVLPNGRGRRAVMGMLTLSSITTLSYADMATAKQARKGLLKAANVYAVPSEALWCAFGETVSGLSL